MNDSHEYRSSVAWVGNGGLIGISRFSPVDEEIPLCLAMTSDAPASATAKRKTVNVLFIVSPTRSGPAEDRQAACLLCVRWTSRGCKGRGYPATSTDRRGASGHCRLPATGDRT